jgi:geranylgeranyl diphosphate synthase type I
MNIENFKVEVNRALTSSLDRYTGQLIEIDPLLIPIANSIRDFLSEGKRFRPIFALLGFVSANGQLSDEIYSAAAALEFLQACALIHDDLMDGSDTRRGKPSIHKQFEVLNGANFGSSAAILIGDMALSWNEQALHDSGISQNAQAAVNPIHDLMRTELMAGQFLDIFEQTQNSFSIERALKIARYKSGKYSIERPLHFGAALAHPDSNKEKLAVYISIYSEYGLPLGEAFQLRDDLLGVFGDPIETGKPAGDDLREGKRTALVSYAYEYGDSNIKTLLIEKLGKELSEHEISTLRDALITSGAVAHIEDLIEKLSEIALDSIERDELNPIGKKLLSEMVELVTKRSF